MIEPSASGTGRRFHLREIIGEGAFGQVFLAEQDSGAGFKRKVALKLLNSNVARSREAGRRMRDEARILGLLSHRNIVTVLDLVRLGDRWAVIMDYVPGADLEQILDALDAREEPFPIVAALEIGAAMCMALKSAHAAVDNSGTPLKIVHRDIKPSNVRLTLDGEVKVLDFGVARVQLESRESSTRGSAWLGTERYMAPERILCESDDSPGDIYATAATLVELLTKAPLGRTPVLPERHAPFVEVSLDRIAYRIDDDDFANDLNEVLRGALDADPEARPSAAELADSLRILARRADDDDLVAFCSGFVPDVNTILGQQVRPADGVLSEVSMAMSGGTQPVENQSAPTLMPDEAGDPLPVTEEFEAAPAQRSAGPLVAVVAILGLGGMVLAAIAGIYLANLFARPNGASGNPDAPNPVLTAPVEPVVEPEPVIEPETVEPVAEPETVEPVVEPETVEPVVEPEPAVEPAAVEPVPDTPPPTEPDPPEPEVVEPAADAPRVSGALFVLPDASGLRVTCGDMTKSGTASVRLRNFPAGSCAVAGTYLGTAYTTTVTVESRKEVRCAVSGGLLECR